MRQDGLPLPAEIGADRVARKRRDLLAAFSHDMRTSLNDIVGFASILDDEIPGRLNTRQHGYLGKIIGGADKLLRLVENLLAWGALESGDMPMRRDPADFAEVVGEAADELRPIADNRMTRIHQHVDVPGRPLLDRRSLVLVLGNLIGNALRLNGLGGLIEVEARVDGGEILTRVSDHGPSLTAEEADVVLDSPDDIAHGSAQQFGLALCKRLIEAHGGSMGVERGSGAGNTFWFRLPYEVGAESAEVA